MIKRDKYLICYRKDGLSGPSFIVFSRKNKYNMRERMRHYENL